MATYPAKGKVLFDGKPTPRAVVWLQPEAEEKPGEPRPHGEVNEDGVFELSTFRPGDGAPAGRYRPVIFWYENWAKNIRKGGDEQGRNLLPSRYQDPRNSGLPVVEIKAEPNAIPILELKR